jgi:hypothetical protein
MFIWLASYPKSGNTLVRSMLSAYYFSQDGNYNFQLIKNIKQFPHGGLFLKMGIDIENHNETVKNYIKAQESFNQKNKTQFLKTHSFLFNFNKNFPFTNFENTLGVIYIVRDPRNIVTSFSKFRSFTVEQTADFMISGTGDGLVWTNNWSVNYHSWKLFKEYGRYLLVKYEDLISEPDKTFLNILEFIHKLNKTNFKLDKKKFENVIKTTSFDSMQKLEKEKGFTESWVDEKTGKKIPFFNLGPKNDWKKKLDTKIAEKLEKAFKSEMEELGYL